MGRPGSQLSQWDDLAIGQAVHFFTGAGWKTATVLGNTDHSAKILYTIGNNDRHITITDPRNIRTKDGTTGDESTVAKHGFNESRRQGTFDLGHQ